jgi:DHA1 family bicyclomycin/chloramphenicol resistance-like MFS transporter
VAGLVLYTVAGLLCAIAPNVWALVGLRAVQGFGGAFVIVVANAVVRDLTSGATAARFFSLLMLVTGLAPVFAPIAGSQLLRVTSWEWIFVALAVLSATMLAISAVGLPETLPAERRHRGGLNTMGPVFTRLLSDRVFTGYVLANSFAFAAMFAYISGSPFVLENVYGLSPLAFGLVFGANSVGIVAFSQLSGLLVERTGPRRLFAIGVLAMAVGSTGLLASTLLDAGLVPFLACLIVTISAIGLILPNATALAMADQPHVAGSASALFGLGQFGVGAVAAPLVGIAGSHDALPMAVTIAVCGLGALLLERTVTPRT